MICGIKGEMLRSDPALAAAQTVKRRAEMFAVLHFTGKLLRTNMRGAKYLPCFGNSASASSPVPVPFL